MTNNMCHGTFIEHALCNSLNALQNTVKKGKDFYACCPQMGSSDPVSGQSHQIIPCCHCFPQIVSPAHEAVDVTSWDQDWNKNEKEKLIFFALSQTLLVLLLKDIDRKPVWKCAHKHWWTYELHRWTEQRSNEQSESCICMLLRKKKKRGVSLSHKTLVVCFWQPFLLFRSLSYCAVSACFSFCEVCFSVLSIQWWNEHVQHCMLIIDVVIIVVIIICWARVENFVVVNWRYSSVSNILCHQICR